MTGLRIYDPVPRTVDGGVVASTLIREIADGRRGAREGAFNTTDCPTTTMAGVKDGDVGEVWKNPWQW